MSDDEADEKVKRNALHRQHRARVAGSRNVPTREWEGICAEAAQRVRAFYRRVSPTFAPPPLTPDPEPLFQTRVITCDFVAIRAEYVLGLEERLAELEAENAALRISERAAREFYRDAVTAGYIRAERKP